MSACAAVEKEARTRQGDFGRSGKWRGRQLRQPTRAPRLAWPAATTDTHTRSFSATPSHRATSALAHAKRIAISAPGARI